MNRAQRRAARHLVPQRPDTGSDLRDNCAECRSTHLVWGPARELPFVVPRADADSALDLLAQLPDVDSAEAWLCRDCSNFGVFSGSWVRF